MISALRRVRLPLAAAVSCGVVALSLFVYVQRTDAATFTVDSLADDNGAGTTLREAILAANANPGVDTVVVPAGTFNLDGTKAQIGITDDIVITGAGASQTIISGDVANQHILFIVSPGTDVTFEDVTLEEGIAQSNNSGGAIQAIAVGSLTIRDSVIRSNSAQFGGAIYTSQNLNLGPGTITIENSTFSGNATRLGPGGAIRALNNPITIIDSTFEDNVTHTVQGQADANGGAIEMTGGTLDLTGSTFSNNIADDGGSGAALYIDGAIATIVNSTISGNFARSHGGGIVATVGSEVELIHTTVAQNTAVVGGAGLYVLGLDDLGGSIDLKNSLIHNNQSVANSNCETVAPGTITSSGGNLSDDTTCTGLTDPTDLNNNSLTTLAALADNGGNTETHALVAGSSAVDAVTCLQDVTDDQRDVSRPQGTSCDIGAFELEASTSPSTDPPASSDSSTTTTTTTTTVGGGGATTTIVGGSGGGATTTDGGSGPSLPNTGSPSPGSLPFIAAMLITGGAAVVLAVRRRPASGG